MSSTGAAAAAAAPSRLATGVIWLAILAPLPYSLSRILWAVGIPVGISSDELRSYDIPGRGSLTLVGLVVLVEITAVFVHVFVLGRAETVPRWVPLLRGRPVRPRMVVAILLAPIAILAYANAISAAVLLGVFELPDSAISGEDWGIWTMAAVFALWGAALTGAAAVHHHRTRGFVP